MDDKTPQILHDYLDGSLDDAQRAELEARLSADAVLGRELEAIRTFRAAVRLLPRQVEPDRDLWPNIESRLGTRGRKAVDFGQFRARKRLPMATPLVAAAAILILALAAPFLRVSKSGVPIPAVIEAVVPADPELERVTAQYLAARDELMALLELRKADMAPETFAVVEENLSVITGAVAEIETALAAQPDSQKLERMLYAAYRSEVNLLRQAVQLSGDPEASNPPADANGGDSDEV